MADSNGLRAEAARTKPRQALQVHGLGKRVPLPSGELTILKGVGFDIAHGDTVAVVGASGSGKSTLLSLLAGLDSPSDGQVLLDGEPLSALDEDGRARVRGAKVGFVFQSFQLLPSLTALENVMLPLELRGDADVEGPARQILHKVGLAERVDH
ncbi:MAG: ATP-binding cassette domain-containing protein, partial [Lysobacteraceae bacterium]